MKTHRVWLGVAGIGIATGGIGCGHSASRPVYSGPTGTATTVAAPVGVAEQRGRIISVRDVEIRDAAPASSSSSGGKLATAVGVVMGNIGSIARAVGDVVDSAKPSRPGEELTILVDDGRTVQIVQELGDPPFAPGDRVVIQKGVSSGGGGGTSRVIREPYFAADARPNAERTRFGVLPGRVRQ
jgi:outer membrane lipoprotein SlyB